MVKETLSPDVVGLDLREEDRVREHLSFYTSWLLKELSGRAFVYRGKCDVKESTVCEKGELKASWKCTAQVCLR